MKAIFKACDHIRDEELTQLGIRLEDKAIGEVTLVFRVAICVEI